MMLAAVSPLSFFLATKTRVKWIKCWYSWCSLGCEAHRTTSTKWGNVSNAEKRKQCLLILLFLVDVIMCIVRRRAREFSYASCFGYITCLSQNLPHNDDVLEGLKRDRTKNPGMDAGLTRVADIHGQ